MYINIYQILFTSLMQVYVYLDNRLSYQCQLQITLS